MASMHPLPGSRRLGLPLFSLLCVVLVVGCGGNDAATISALEAINDKLVGEGGRKAVRMQKEGDNVGAIYILSHVDEVMPHIAKLNHVVEVYFQDDSFTDEHVQYIKPLKSLNSLVLSDTQITDSGVAELTGLQLEALFLERTGITSAALESIGQMTTLTSLDLSGTKVADNLQPLVNLDKLAWLLLRDTDLSSMPPESIKALEEMPGLARLTVTNSNLPADVAKQLADARPAMKLETGGGDAPPPSDDPTAAEMPRIE